MWKVFWLLLNMMHLEDTYYILPDNSHNNICVFYVTKGVGKSLIFLFSRIISPSMLSSRTQTPVWCIWNQLLLTIILSVSCFFLFFECHLGVVNFSTKMWQKYYRTKSRLHYNITVYQILGKAAIYLCRFHTNATQLTPVELILIYTDITKISIKSYVPNQANMMSLCYLILSSDQI